MATNGDGKLPKPKIAAGKGCVNAKKARIAAAKKQAKQLLNKHYSEEGDSGNSSASMVVKLQKELTWVEEDGV